MADRTPLEELRKQERRSFLDGVQEDDLRDKKETEEFRWKREHED